MTLLSVGMLLDQIVAVLPPEFPLAQQIVAVQALHRGVLDGLLEQRALLTTPTTTTH